MKLTQHTDLGLRALLFLAAHPDELVSTRRIAVFFGVSRNHLTKVVQSLAAHGYVETQRGPGGGLRLRRAPASLTVGEVVRALEPGFELVECFQSDGGDCPITPSCSLAPLLDEAQAAFLAALDRRTLADLLRPRSALAAQLRAV